jgi:hypothetical protein
MKKPKFPEISKLPTPWKVGVVDLALLTTAAYEAVRQRNFGNLTPWESHTITIFYCATLVFILSALFLQREAANVHESSALNQSLMESLPGVVCVFDSWGNIGRWNSNFLGYSAADIMRTGIGTVTPESLQTVQQISKPIKLEELFSVIANVVPNIHRSPEAKDLVRR